MSEAPVKLNNRSRPFLNRRRTYWGFKMSPDESEKLAEAIRASGVSITDFLRTAANSAASRVLRRKP
jgi:uncharacterized protein (DUF1778 family)